jgi:hypothetical protein
MIAGRSTPKILKLSSAVSSLCAGEKQKIYVFDNRATAPAFGGWYKMGKSPNSIELKLEAEFCF